MNVLSQTAKVIISSGLSLIAIALYIRFRGKTRKLCLIAMLLSTAGDFFMTDTFGLGDASLYPGAAFFIAAHVVYALCFMSASKEKGFFYRNRGFWTGTVLAAAAAAVLAVITALAKEPQWVMFCLILVYLAVIGWNLASQYSFAFSEGGLRKLLYLGMGLFLVSDFIVFLPMLTLCREFNDLVWATYIPAQLLIILFNSNFNQAEGRRP